MIDATHLKAHRTAASLLKKGCSPSYRAHQGRTELQAPTVSDVGGRQFVVLLSEGQMSDHQKTHLVLDALPPARSLIADWGYDSAWFRDALATKRYPPLIPSSASLAVPRLLQDPLSATAQASRIRSPSSRTGDALPPATIHALTRPSLPSGSSPEPR